MVEMERTTKPITSAPNPTKDVDYYLIPTIARQLPMMGLYLMDLRRIVQVF
jgi:hypothetical protein